MRRILSFSLLVFIVSSAAVADRLPRDVFPSHYSLRLEPDLDAGAFLGEVEIEVGVQRRLREVELHAAEIEVLEASIQSGGATQSAAVSYDESSQTIVLAVENSIAPGRSTLSIRYRGILNDDLRGFYRGVSNGVPYASTQMEATEARRAFPCFDEPGYKATFDLTLVVDENHVVFSNGAIVETTEGPEIEKKTVRFETTPRMPTYLVAVAVGDFSCLESATSKVPIRVCADPQKIDLGRYALEAAEWLIPFFENAFQVEYPFEKLDNVGIADFEAGAMENLGAIFYRESDLLVDDTESSLSERQRVAVVVAHEIAHQWFGDLVTMDWWDDLWLKEGFADFMTMEALEEWKPEWAPVVEGAAAAGWPLSSDTLSGARQIRAHAETPEEINSLFDGITYGKAATVLGMIQSYVGKDAMREGIRLFLTRNAFGNASAIDLFEAVAQASEKPVVSVMESFVSQPGVPRVRVSSKCEEETTLLTLEQDRFFVDGSLLGSAPEQSWKIPICPASGECLLLTEAAQTFRLEKCRDSLFLNHQGHGYFVTEYANETARDFRRVLWTELTAADRLILARDEWFLVRAGRRSVGDYLDLLDALSAETEPGVFGEFLGTLETLEERLVTHQTRPTFQLWVRELLDPILAKVQWSRQPYESERVSQLRQRAISILGDLAGDSRVVDPARRATEAYLAGLPIDPNAIRTSLSLAAQHGDVELYERYLEALGKAVSPQQANLILGTLGKFRDPALIDRTLSLALSDTVRSQDLFRVFRGLTGNPQAEERSWEYLREHWAEYLAKVPAQNHPFILPLAGRGICDADRREDFRSFAAGKDFNREEMARTEEVVSNCISFREEHRTDFSQWLSSRYRR